MNELYLIVTIDIEADDWDDFKRDGGTLNNIKEIPKLQALFDDFGILPAYLIDYSVASDNSSYEILGKIFEEGKCEIGTHLHPWNTPPYEEEICVRNSMLNNLSATLQQKKLTVLTEKIETTYGIRPRSFRAGRWAFNKEIAKAIIELDYVIDTSVTPFVSWHEYFGPSFLNAPYYPYWIDPSKDILSNSNTGRLLEIPVTIGFNRTNFKFSNKLFEVLGKSMFTSLRLRGLAYKLGLLQKIWLSPEMSNHIEMRKLVNIYVKKNINIINLMFHSTTLVPGLTPFVKNSTDQKKFYQTLRMFFKSILEDYNIKPVFISQLSKLL